MAYDEQLAGRLRESLAHERQVAEKAMFGRRMFLVAGNLAVGVAGEELMVRVGEEAGRHAISQPHARPCVMGGRPMKDWILVGAEGVATEGPLDAWVQRGVAFARSLINE